MKLERRGYELRAIAAIETALSEHRRVVAVGPTGCGKTVVAAMVIKRAKLSRVLFVAHKHELVDQAHAQLAAQGIKAGVIMAQDERLHGADRVDPSARVQVASVQTIARRGGPDRVDIIVVDEAHRIMADSYQGIVEAYPHALVLGLTATPERLDGKALCDFFAHMVTIAKPSELYASGHLVRPRVYVAPEKAAIELSKRMKGAAIGKGDYTDTALAKIVDSGMLVGEVVSEALRLAPKVPKVVFAGSRKHSEQLCARFRRRGVKAVHLDSHTEPHEREAMLEDLRAGRIEAICNVGVLTEGWDLPALGAVIIARPTRSKTLLFQMAGRVQRPYKGRTAVVIDHGNCCIALGIDPRDDYPWSLEGKEGSDSGEVPVKSCAECQALIAAGCTTCPECGAVQPKSDRQVREEIEAKLVELERSRLRERVEAMAKKKNAPKGWAEKVMEGLR